MDMQESAGGLVFIHLSDIHFRKGRAGDVHDEDEMLRNELELDLRRLRARLPRLSGLILSGDIAYGGKAEEYEYAYGWIESIRENLGCDVDCIMTTPGNHDVDQASIPLDGDVDRVHQGIREAGSIEGHDAKLAEALRDEKQGAILFSPLDTYNAFAKKYGCEITREHPYWERDYALGDGTVLRFRGIATTLLSSSRDNDKTHRMLYGGAQRTFLRKRNVRYAAVGHHPPSWSVDGDNADHVFSTLTFLQVFGHKHEHWLTPVGNSVRIIAGAVHPSRQESNWLPRYSALSISPADGEHLAIRIYPRKWSTEEFAFIGDYNSRGQDYRDFTVRVDPRQLGGDENGST